MLTDADEWKNPIQKAPHSNFVLYNSTHAFEGAKGMIIVVE